MTRAKPGSAPGRSASPPPARSSRLSCSVGSGRPSSRTPSTFQPRACTVRYRGASPSGSWTESARGSAPDSSTVCTPGRSDEPAHTARPGAARTAGRPSRRICSGRHPSPPPASGTATSAAAWSSTRSRSPPGSTSRSARPAEAQLGAHRGAWSSLSRSWISRYRRAARRRGHRARARSRATVAAAAPPDRSEAPSDAVARIAPAAARRARRAAHAEQPEQHVLRRREKPQVHRLPLLDRAAPAQRNLPPGPAGNSRPGLDHRVPVHLALASRSGDRRAQRPSRARRAPRRPRRDVLPRVCSAFFASSLSFSAPEQDRYRLGRLPSSTAAGAAGGSCGHRRASRAVGLLGKCRLAPEHRRPERRVEALAQVVERERDQHQRQHPERDPPESLGERRAADPRARPGSALPPPGRRATPTAARPPRGSSGPAPPGPAPRCASRRDAPWPARAPAPGRGRAATSAGTRSPAPRRPRSRRAGSSPGGRWASAVTRAKSCAQATAGRRPPTCSSRPSAIIASVPLANLDPRRAEGVRAG